NSSLEKIFLISKNGDHIARQRQIALPDGSVYTVTINYKNENSANLFDPGDVVTKFFSVSDSILKLKPAGIDWMHPFGTDSIWEWTWSWHSDLRQVLQLTDQMRSFNDFNFQKTLNEQVADLLKDQLQTVALQKSTSLTITISLDAILAAYVKAYLDGSY